MSRSCSTGVRSRSPATAWAWRSQRDSGRNAADDDIAALVEADPDPSDLTVVTSDADLRRRVSEHGAAVEGAGTFLRRLEGG